MLDFFQNLFTGSARLRRLNTLLESEIAGRKRVEAELGAERHLLRTLLDNLPDRIFLKDTEGRFMWNNAAHLKELGLTQQSQALGKTDADFFPKAHAEKASEDERIVMATREPLHQEEKIISPNGQVNWALVTKLPHADEHGKVVGTFGIARDINKLKRVEHELVRWQRELESRVKERTEELARAIAALEKAVHNHERTEQALRHSEEQIRQVVEANPSALLMVDDRGKIRLVNSETERLFCYRREELLNQPVDLLVPGRFLGNHRQLRDGFFSAPEARPMGEGRELFAVRKDGTEVPVEIGLNPIRSAEGSFVLASVMDITERKRAEQMITGSLREKETLLKEVHHRVKNNLQIISSILQLQAGYLKDSQALNAFQECQDRIRSMALIHEKLYQAGDFARINFAEYVQSLVNILMRSYRSTSCTVKLTQEIEVVSLNLNIAIPFALILNEAITNSLKHAFPSQSQGNIWVRLHQDQDGIITLCVRDDGLGLPAAIDHTHPSSLGLRLITILAEQLHGTLEFVTHPGTTMTLTTPPSLEP